VGPVAVIGVTASVKPVVLDEGCSISRFPVDDVGSIEKKLIRVSLPPFEEFFSPTFHADSSANQIRSVVGRVLGVVPKPTTGGIAPAH